MGSVQIESHLLAECAFCFFGTMSKVFEEAFAPYLNAVVECLFQSCQVAEVEEGQQAEEDDFNVDVDDDNDFDNTYAINNAIAEEKETAIEALGVIFENASQPFAPYLEKMIQIVQELCDHSHEGVRRACIGTFFRVVTAMWKTYYKDMEWASGLPVQYQVDNNVAHMIKIVMDEAIKTYDEEEDKNVVATLNTEIIDALRVMGPVLVAGHLEPLAQHVLNLLEKKAPCQAELDMEEEGASEEDEDQAEYDAMVISTTADLIGMLSQAVGEQFSPCFKHFWPLLKKYYKPTRPVSDRSMAIGVMGEVAGGMKKEITPYTQDMLNLAVAALTDEDDEVRSNAAYATGTVCFHSSLDLSG